MPSFDCPSHSQTCLFVKEQADVFQVFHDFFSIFHLFGRASITSSSSGFENLKLQRICQNSLQLLHPNVWIHVSVCGIVKTNITFQLCEHPHVLMTASTNACRNNNGVDLTVWIPFQHRWLCASLRFQRVERKASIFRVSHNSLLCKVFKEFTVAQ